MCIFSPLPSSELLHSVQLLEGDGVGAAGLRQDFSVCHSQLHRRALHGPGQRPAGGLTLGGRGGRGRGSPGEGAVWTPEGGDDPAEPPAGLPVDGGLEGEGCVQAARPQ